MNFLKDRRTVLALGGGVFALLAGLAIAWTMVARHRGETTQPPPASHGGLVIDSSNPNEPRLDQTKPLRCFVAGRSVGDLTLAECAKRNGVATDALDVGLDQSGALAAGGQAGTAITPLPPPDSRAEEAAPAETPNAPAAGAPVAAGPPDACWRYASGQWRRLPNDMPLATCVQALFAGRCVRAGDAAYGRWAQQTLRLAPGRVEISSDNHNFRPLMDQAGCPPAG
ncbi:MAG TPA: hypothetical protein VFE18_01680 [Phenylobacterium sp.]|jgi:hypothetical protein|uniref:hypothetical protein n=1 Tax=Phenylobacterium sp. TaxID=1871053 RepID=UPI002D58B635|nr:hypothetical protein [Phenylobacterium sp.]HZZ66859.1 hypothetical protein [Phenylobacterium sp.]